ncbi:MAG: hypothetical protein WCK02_01065 [Bacteroidota bacterium]
MKTKIILLIVGFVYFLACFWLEKIPFFWDYTTLSETAQKINLQGFGLQNLSLVDSRQMLLYGYYLSACWTVFGKTLFVSHLVVLPFILGLTYEFIKLSEFFNLNKLYIFIGLLLLVADPTISTQIILMGFDITLVYLFLAALNSIFQNNVKMLIFYMSILALFSMRGIMLLPVLVLFNLYFNKYNLKLLTFFSIPLFLSLIHLYIAKSGIAEDSSRQIVSLEQFFRNCIYIFWKICDFGRIFLLISIVILYKSIPKSLKVLLLLLFVFFIFTMAPFSNPIGHRYFMILTVIMIIALLISIEKLYFNRQVAILGIIVCFLISGNFWLYHVKYGNGWDGSLKVLSYFETKDKLDLWLKEKKIEKKNIISGFPLLANNMKTNLSENTDEFADRRTDTIENYKYVVYSNVCNEFTQQELNSIKQNWKLIKSFQNGQVEISVYQNPNNTLFQNSL